MNLKTILTLAALAATCATASAATVTVTPWGTLGPFASVEQAVLAEAVPPSARNVAFGRYSLTGGLFNAAGGLAATAAIGDSVSRAFFLVYAAIGVVTAVLPLFMSPRVEAPGRPVAFGKFRPLAGLAALFALDSLGGGFVANAVIAYWMHVRFAVDVQVLGPLFAAVAILQSLSYEVSGRLGNRFGLVNTMVFTHLPANLLLLLVPFSPNLAWAAGLLLARFALSQMDVPVRQAYVVSIVPPEERAGAVAMTGAVRGVAQSVGPVLAGLAIGAASFGLPFFAGGGLKIVYDIALFAGFRNRRAAHER